MIAVFARANHPLGWGSPSFTEGGGLMKGKAHGYVVLAITYKDKKQLARVVKLLLQYPDGFRGFRTKKGYSEGQLTDWYGGQFELLFTLPGNKLDWPDVGQTGPYQQRGDNRFVGHYDAAEILEEYDV